MIPKSKGRTKDHVSIGLEKFFKKARKCKGNPTISIKFSSALIKKLFQHIKLGLFMKILKITSRKIR